MSSPDQLTNTFDVDPSDWGVYTKEVGALAVELTYEPQCKEPTPQNPEDALAE